MNLYQPTITGSLSVSGSVNISGSISIAGGGTISGTASIATTALTASSADNLLVRNTLTAQTLVVQTITSSVDFVTGSTQFGSLLTNTHVFSGSISMNPGGLFVTSSGLVGIGTTNPANFLHINGLNPNLIIQNTTSSVGSESNLTFRSTFGDGNIAYLGYIRAIQQSTTQNTGDIAIHAYSTGSANEVIRIKGATGNVGIGTSNPQYQMTVLNTVNVGMQSYTIDNNGSRGGLRLYSNNSTGSPFIKIGSAYSAISGAAYWWRNWVSSPNSNALIWETGEGSVLDGSNNEPSSWSEKLRIDGNGLITAPYMTGKSFAMTSGAGTGTAITDTGIYYNSGDWGGFGRSTMYLVTFSANPNNGGSGEYSAVHVGYITVYTGWSGSNVTTYIAYTQVTQGNNIGALTLFPTFWNGSSESNAVTRGSISGWQIRIKISGYNSSFTGANQALYVQKIITSG